MDAGLIAVILIVACAGGLMGTFAVNAGRRLRNF